MRRRRLRGPQAGAKEVLRQALGFAIDVAERAFHQHGRDIAHIGLRRFGHVFGKAAFSQFAARHRIKKPRFHHPGLRRLAINRASGERFGRERLRQEPRHRFRQVMHDRTGGEPVFKGGAQAAIGPAFS